MDKETLESYQLVKSEIECLKRKIARLNKDPCVSDVVLRSNPEFPYELQTIRLEGEDTAGRRKLQRMLRQLRDRTNQLMELDLEIEIFIAAIKDSTLRMIFRYRYLEGLTYEQIGKRLHLDRSRISRKIDQYLKNAHKTQK